MSRSLRFSLERSLVGLVFAVASCNVATDDWHLPGNAGTDPTQDFVGTTDETPLEMRVNGVRAQRYEPTISAPNVIGGSDANSVFVGAWGATIAGGGDAGFGNLVFDHYGYIGGGRSNLAGSNDGAPTSAQHATIGGGENNQAGGEYSTVAGGSLNRATGAQAFVGGGSSNIASNTQAAVAGGGGNTSSGGSSFVGAGSTNAATADNAAVAGGAQCQATAGTAFVGAGTGNTASAIGAAVVGGSANSATDTFAMAGAGQSNTAGGPLSFLGAGFDNQTLAFGSFIGGGTQNNTAFNAQWSAIVGGASNQTNDDNNFIGAGDTNLVTGTAAAIVAGSMNQTNGIEAFVGAGAGNIAGNTTAAIVAGNLNQANALASFIGAGTENLTSGDQAAIGAGEANQATGTRAFVGAGNGNVAGGISSAIPGGIQARTEHRGQFAMASGAFVDAGDAQTCNYVLRNGSTESGTVELFLDGASERLTIAPGRSVTFDCIIVGRAGNGFTLGFHFSGVIKNVGGATTLLGSKQLVNSDFDAGITGSPDAEVVADDVNDALVVHVTGGTNIGFTYRWVASIRTVEVAFP